MSQTEISLKQEDSLVAWPRHETILWNIYQHWLTHPTWDSWATIDKSPKSRKTDGMAIRHSHWSSVRPMLRSAKVSLLDQTSRPLTASTWAAQTKSLQTPTAGTFLNCKGSTRRTWRWCNRSSWLQLIRLHRFPWATTLPMTQVVSIWTSLSRATTSTMA